MEHSIPIKAALGSFGSVANRAKGGFNWVAGSDALPMYGREIIEGQ
jgi:hypothetical protein